MNDPATGARARLLLSCLGEASRFRLARALCGQDRCVGELALAVGLSQSCTTRHLQALERAGLVRKRREGRRVRFRLCSADPELSGLLGWALGQGEPAVAEPRSSTVIGGPSVGRRSRSGDRAGAAGGARRSPREGGRSARAAGSGTEQFKAGPGSAGAAGMPGTEPRRDGAFEPTGVPPHDDAPDDRAPLRRADDAPPSNQSPAPRPGDLEDYLL